MKKSDEIIIREYQEGDETQINLLHNQEYGKTRNVEEWRWEFLEGPFGEAILVVAEFDGKIVGTQALLPAYLSWKGQRLFTAKSEETLIVKEFRGQGIFDKMYDKCFELAVQRGIALIWGFTRAAKPFRNIGFCIPDEVSWSILILDPSQTYQLNKNRIPPDIVRRFPFPAILLLLLRALTIAGFSWGKVRGIMKRPASGFEVVLMTEVNDRLDAFWHSFSQETDTLNLERTGNYLDWRVFHNPHLHSHLLAATKDDEIQGYIILSKNKHENVGSITDFCVRNKYFSETVRLLMTHALKYFRSQRVAFVDAWYVNSNRDARKYSSSLKRLGFLTIPRVSGIVLKVLAKETDLPVKPTDIERWFITMLFSEGTG